MQDDMRERLSVMLGWDSVMLDGVLQTLESSTQAEAHQMVEELVGDHLTARRTMLQYIQGLNLPLSLETPQQQSNGSSSAAAPHRRSPTQKDVDSLDYIPTRGKRGAKTPAQDAAQSVQPSEPATTDAPQGGTIFGVDSSRVKYGNTSAKAKAKAKRAAAAADATAAEPRHYNAAKIAGMLTRPVVNCLACGKIYDARGGSQDALALIRANGTCTHCGAVIPSLRKQLEELGVTVRTEGNDAAVGDASAGAVNSSTGAGGGRTGELQQGASSAGAQPLASKSEDDRKAQEFKNRLVEYDRNSAKRTVVIDDQSDFFQFEGNTWLSQAEKVVLQERLREQQEREEQRKRQVRVTVDLVGRQVHLTEGDGPLEFVMGSDAKPATDAEQQRKRDITTAAERTLREVEQGGGTAARAAIATLHQQPNVRPGGLTPSTSPMLQHIHPVFIPAKDRQAGTKAGPKQAAKNGEQPAAAHAEKVAATVRSMSGARVQQADVFDTLLPANDAHGLGGVYEAEAAAAAAEAEEGAGNEAFDICLPAKGGQPTKALRNVGKAARDREGSGKSAAVRQQRAIHGGGDDVDMHLDMVMQPADEALPPGMVLLRGWLSPEQQASIVQVVRGFGKAHGGFYTPSYASGGEMQLKMFCFGRHWEVREREYQPTRAQYDGAKPPPLPRSLVQLAEAAVSAAQKRAGAEDLPLFSPDVCVVNFYEKEGRLGLHQDRDEAKETILLGLPIVSFSIGDSAWFAYGWSRGEAASRLLLTSGDVLVFGGMFSEKGLLESI